MKVLVDDKETVVFFRDGQWVRLRGTKDDQLQPSSFGLIEYFSGTLEKHASDTNSPPLCESRSGTVAIFVATTGFILHFKMRGCRRVPVVECLQILVVGISLDDFWMIFNSATVSWVVTHGCNGRSSCPPPAAAGDLPDGGGSMDLP